MKLATWNINSIRLRKENVITFLKEESIDIIFLQETKTTDEFFPEKFFYDYGYTHIYFRGEKSYNGVAVLSKLPVELVADTLPGNKKDEQARFLEVKVKVDKPFNIGSIYLPNGNPIDTDKFPYKLEWMKRLKSYTKKKIDNFETFIFGGDFNIIPSADDAIDIEKWKKDALHHPDSIKLYREIMNLGLSDVFRIYNSKPYEFTYWDYSRGAWEKDNGLRIDHFLASPAAVDRLVDCQIEKQFRGLERPSDHVPIWLQIK